MAEGEAKNLQQQMDESVKNLGKLVEDMQKELERIHNIKKSVFEARDAAYAEKLNEVNQGKSDAEKVTELTDEQKREVNREFRSKIQTPDSDLFKSLKEGINKFFDEQQKVIEEEQKKVNEVYSKAKEEELEKTNKRLTEIENELKKEGLTDKDKEELEKEASELKKYKNFLEKDFDKKLATLKRRLSQARDTIMAQKQRVNVISERMFNAPMCMVDKNKGKDKEQGGEGQDKEESKDKEKDGEEQADEQILDGTPAGFGAQQQGGNGRQTQQGGVPFTWGAPQQQQGVPQQAQGQGQQQQQTEEHIPTAEELLEEASTLKYDGRGMTATQALEYLRKYSTFDAKEKKVCLKNGGLKIIQEATRTLSEKGGELSRADKNLLAEYSKTIAETSKAMADSVAEEYEKLKESKKYSLATALGVSIDDPNVKEAMKYFESKKGFLGIGKKGPQVIYDYNSIPNDIKELFDRAEKEFEEKQKQATQKIIDLQEKLKDPNLTADEKKKIKDEEIPELKVARAEQREKFEKSIGGMIRTGKALALSKRIERVAQRVQRLSDLDHSDREDETSFEDELGDQTKTPEEIERERQENKAKARFRAFTEEKEEFVTELQRKLNEGEEITFEDFAKYNQYKSYGVVDLPDIDSDTVTKIYSSKETEYNDIINKCRRIDDDIRNGISPEELLSDEEIHILVGLGVWDVSDILDKGIYYSKDSLDSYLGKYDLTCQAEKKVEEAERSSAEDPNRETQEDPDIE